MRPLVNSNFLDEPFLDIDQINPSSPNLPKAWQKYGPTAHAHYDNVLE